MNFNDFADNPKELIGKLVLHTSGFTYSDRTNKCIRVIKSVSKTAFKITNSAALFSLTNGSQKGLSGKQNMGNISECKLITEDEANDLRTKWKEQKEIKAL